MSANEKYLFVGCLLFLFFFFLKKPFITRQNRKKEEFELLLEGVRAKMRIVRESHRELTPQQKIIFGGLEQKNLDSQSRKELEKIEAQLYLLLPTQKVNHNYVIGGSGFIPPSIAKEKKILAKAKADSKSQIAKQAAKLKEGRVNQPGLRPRPKKS